MLLVCKHAYESAMKTLATGKIVRSEGNFQTSSRQVHEIELILQREIEIFMRKFFNRIFIKKYS